MSANDTNTSEMDQSNVNPMMVDEVKVGLTSPQAQEPQGRLSLAEVEEIKNELKEMADRRRRSENLLQKSKQEARPGQTLLGTFMGVYVPTTQNILGIILFIRLPWITGQAGIIQAAAIVSMGCISSCLTSLSMSAIATNGRVSAGGCYQIIKKSLGNEFGGVVGILLFLSNNFGVAMYVLGFVEALQDAFPDATISSEQTNDNRAIGACTLLFLTFIVYIGISYISKFALLFLSGVVLSIFSIFLGVFVHTGYPVESDGVVGLTYDNVSENINSAYTSGNSFATLLALFFPAVTDPLAGSNLSGDLQNAAHSIPPGTLYAVFTTTCIFLSQVVLTGGSVLRANLLSDKLIVTKVAWPFPELIYGGIMLSTLGAGLQSLAGAPRLLAAIARDDLIPVLRPLVPPPGTEPRKIVLLCCTISMCVLMLGELDAVAPFITMWFLTCYAIINGACFMLSYENSPGFRPAWKYFHWCSALAGMLICLGMMFFIAWHFALAALCLSAILYKWIERTLASKSVELVEAQPMSPNLTDEEKIQFQANQHAMMEAQSERADWASGMRFNTVRKALLGLQERDYEFKYWRPFILFLCKLSPEDQKYVPQRGMINLIQQLMKRGKGMSFIAGVVEGDYTKENMALARNAARLLTGTMREKKIEGFPEVIVAPSIYEGQRFLIQGKGFGPLRPNTVMLGFPTDLDSMSEKAKRNYVGIYKDTAIAGKTLIVCKGTVDFPDKKEVRTGFVDVWWVFDILPARGLLLLLPYLLQQHKAWSSTKTRLFVVTGYDESMDQLQSILEDMLSASGLHATVHILQMEASDAPRYTNVGQSQKTLLRSFSSSPSIMGLTDYLANISLDIESQNRRSGLASPDPSLQNIQENEEDDTPVDTPVGENGEALSPNNRGVQHHISQSSKKRAEERRGSYTFLSTDKYGSRLTAAFKKYSADSALVVMALPKQQRMQTPQVYLDSLDVLIADLPLVMMVQESGAERIQLYG